MRAEDFALVQTLALETAGIVIEPEKMYLVEHRLESLLRRKNLVDIAELLEPLRRHRSPELCREIVEAMMNGETLFFRDIATFDMLRLELLPRLVAARERQRSLVIWSAACSTGQEPYSLAMLLAEHFPMLAGWDVQLIATDFSEEHLSRARAGRYSQYEINRGLPAAMLVRHFRQEDQHWVVRPELRERVRFARTNLVADAPPAPWIDLVLLRNVMIYWEPATKVAVLARIKRVLAPDGALVLGAAETTLHIDESFERVPAGTGNYYACVPPRPSLRPAG